MPHSNTTKICQREISSPQIINYNSSIVVAATVNYYITTNRVSLSRFHVLNFIFRVGRISIYRTIYRFLAFACSRVLMIHSADVVAKLMIASCLTQISSTQLSKFVSVSKHIEKQKNTYTI